MEYNVTINPDTAAARTFTFTAKHYGSASAARGAAIRTALRLRGEGHSPELYRRASAYAEGTPVTF